MNRPTPVTISIVLLWIGAALSLLLSILVFIARETLAAELGNTDKSLFLFVSIVFLVIAAIDAIFALRIGRGGTTARMIYTILALLSIFGAIWSAVTTHQATHALTILLPLIIVGLLWLPESSKQFFAKAS